MPWEPLLVGDVVACRLCVAEEEAGGVRGRDEPDDILLNNLLIATTVDEIRGPTYMESNFSISACEYAAPTTKGLGSEPAFFPDILLDARCGALQKGEAEL